MSDSVERLLWFAQQKTADSDAPIRSEADLKARMRVSAAMFTNWKTRGISKDGALDAEALFGCSAHWLLTGKSVEDLTQVFTHLKLEQIQALPEEKLQNLEKYAFGLLGLIPPIAQVVTQAHAAPANPRAAQIVQVTEAKKRKAKRDEQRNRVEEESRKKRSG